MKTLSASIGRPARTLSLPLSVALLCLLAAPGAKAGNGVLYATPSPDVSADCSEASPCDIRTAVDNAPVGQSIRLEQGVYDVTGDGLELDSSNDMAPVEDASAVINGSGLTGPTLAVTGGSSVSDVEIRSDSNPAGAPALSLAEPGAVAERVSAVAIGPSAGCEIRGGLLRSSVCFNATPPPSTGSPSPPPGPAVSTESSGDESLSPALRNVTAFSRYGAGYVLQANDGSTIVANVRNSILRGQENGAGASDFESYGTGRADADTDFSNYSTRKQTAALGTISKPGTRVNQVAEPKFADAANADFREATGSPTIDRGDKAAGQLGGTDRDGAKRVQGRQIDIGAYETAAPPADPLRVEIQGAPKKKSSSSKAIFRFRARGGTGGYRYFCQLDGRRYKPCSSPRRYGKLGRAGHVFRVGVVDSAGTSSKPETYRWRVVRRNG